MDDDWDGDRKDEPRRTALLFNAMIRTTLP